MQKEKLTYWWYIHLDNLLSIQDRLQTSYKDELIFLTYHQICELYFKLIIHEIELIQNEPEKLENWLNRLNRIDNYFELLIHSFSVLSPKGLSTEEFYEFRNDLKPASGFQTVQFRKIEIMFTDITNLVVDKSDITSGMVLDEIYELIYWKKGAVDMDNGDKSETLLAFEQKYDVEFKGLIKKQKDVNLSRLFTQLKNLFTDKDVARRWDKMKDVVQLKLLHIDNLICDWKYKHFETVGEHFRQFAELDRKNEKNIEKSGGDIKASGGTNAHEFLTQSMKVIRYFRF